MKLTRLDVLASVGAALIIAPAAVIFGRLLWVMLTEAPWPVVAGVLSVIGGAALIVAAIVIAK